jgi:hypothetical protein
MLRLCDLPLCDATVRRLARREPVSDGMILNFIGEKVAALPRSYAGADS